MADQPEKTTTTNQVLDPKLLTPEFFLAWALEHPTLTGKAILEEYVRAFNIGTEDLQKLQEAITRFALAAKAKEAARAKEEEEEKKKQVAPAKPTEAPTPPEETPPKQPTEKPELIITRTKYPKWWNDEGIAKISLTSPGSQFIITARSDYMLYVATIVLTVDGECTITFAFGSAGSSGPMNFGGEGQPKGIVIAMGNSPAPCGYGSFMVTASSEEAVSVGGFVSYYLWKKETPAPS
jgi:hypothetical protein